MNQLIVGCRSRRRADALIGPLCRVNDPAHPSADRPAKTNNTYLLKASISDLNLFETNSRFSFGATFARLRNLNVMAYFNARPLVLGHYWVIIISFVKKYTFCIRNTNIKLYHPYFTSLYCCTPK